MEDFMFSEWFVLEPDNWHLKEDAPADIVKKYNEWKKATSKEGMIVN